MKSFNRRQHKRLIKMGFKPKFKPVSTCHKRHYFYVDSDYDNAIRFLEINSNVKVAN